MTSKYLQLPPFLQPIPSTSAACWSDLLKMSSDLVACWAMVCLGQAAGKGLPEIETSTYLSHLYFASLAMPQSLC